MSARTDAFFVTPAVDALLDLPPADRTPAAVSAAMADRGPAAASLARWLCRRHRIAPGSEDADLVESQMPVGLWLAILAYEPSKAYTGRERFLINFAVRTCVFDLRDAHDARHQAKRDAGRTASLSCAQPDGRTIAESIGRRDGRLAAVDDADEARRMIGIARRVGGSRRAIAFFEAYYSGEPAASIAARTGVTPGGVHAGVSVVARRLRDAVGSIRRSRAGRSAA